MAELVIFKNELGKLEGFGDRGRRAFAKFVKIVSELEVGETLGFQYRLPRSPRHHRFFFAKRAELFDRQETFDDPDRLLEWLKVGSGFCDLLPGIDGVPCAIPRSIAWDALDEQGFIEFTRAMNDFLWTPHAQAVLWPSLDADQRYECIESWHTEFNRP